MKSSNAISPFVEQVIKQPEALALLYNGEKLTYAELAGRVNKYMTYFSTRNVKKGDKVLILQPLSLDLYAALIAMLGMGCTIVFVEEWTGFRDIRRGQDKIQCKFVLCSINVKLVCLFYRGLRRMKRLDLEAIKEPPPNPYVKVPPPDTNINITGVDLRDPAIVSFSSGTSGTSKAIVRTHGILHAQFNALYPHINASPGDMMCTNFPVVILLNLGLGISTLISGAIRISELGKTDFGDLYDEIRANPVTHLAFSPYLMHSLARYMQLYDWVPLKVQQLISGGSPVFPAFVKMIRSQVHSERFTVMYGSSEAEPIACTDAGDIVSFEEQDGLYAGKIDDHTKCKVVRKDDGLFMETKPYEAGELIVSGEHVVKSYLNSEEAYRKNKIMMDGIIWHRTGDFGYFDESGNLFLCGNLAYENMGRQYTLEVEKQLQTLSGIECGTIIKDIAYIQKYDTADEAETAAKVRALFSYLRKVKFVKIPRDKRHNGKIRYGELIDS